ncbi:MAG: DUF6268 family outer membrane beta-barrel protein [Bacteroidota bacterium]
MFFPAIRICSFVLLLIFTWSLRAQDRPSFLQEDLEENPIQLPNLIQPGVKNKTRGRGLELTFLGIPTSPFKAEEGFPLTGPSSQFRFSSISFKLRFPIINRPGFKILGGIIYRPERYHFNSLGTDYREVFSRLDNLSLKSSGFEALILKPLNQENYLAFQLRAVYNGDYAGLISIDDAYGVYSATALYGIKKSDDKEWGIGLNMTSSFRAFSVVPFLLYNHTFSDHWGIETVLPALVSLRYNLNDRSIFLLGLRYNSRSYALESLNDRRELYQLNHSEVRATLSLEQSLTPWVWLEASLGYQYNFSTDFEAVFTTENTFQVEPGAAPFFRLGAFISPPRD